ncbi:MAG: segregation/condensation protein A, partial [Solobacterium sp.]|nr:segregation/condensation protein A [Solobacterium sp.]
MGKEFNITIDQFDGPLDLMLNLIRENKMDLMNLDINLLTDQYIAYLNSMSELQLEIASEYLVEMATLIEYKSKKMLPGNRDTLEGEEEEDPQERLVRRLLEYQQFKEASMELMYMYENRQLMMSRPLSAEADEFMKPAEEEHYTGNPYDLMKAM